MARSGVKWVIIKRETSNDKIQVNIHKSIKLSCKQAGSRHPSTRSCTVRTRGNDERARRARESNCVMPACCRRASSRSTSSLISRQVPATLRARRNDERESVAQESQPRHACVSLAGIQEVIKQHDGLTHGFPPSIRGNDERESEARASNPVMPACPEPVEG